MFGGDRISCDVPRLRREDCGRIKHDRGFSKWQILVGPSDWEDYSLGKEGVEKYRVHNLPRDSCPGIYELGIAVTRTGFGRDVERLDPDRIVVVYLGQADNARTRLQDYGRSGSHLGNASSTGPTMVGGGVLNKGPGLFEGIFSRGYPIVFRWATMQSKSDARKIETRLLNTYDYGWNATDNGVRRPYDVLQKLKDISSSTPTHFNKFMRRFVPFEQKQVGIRINKPSDSGAEESLFSPVFKFGRSQPRLVQHRSGVIVQDNDAICGVVSGPGLVCQNPPVEGRKRCTDHKGMRIKGSSSLSLAQPSPSHEWIRIQTGSYGGSICGFILANWSPCNSQPIRGNKRCAAHKGKRIC